MKSWQIILGVLVIIIAVIVFVLVNRSSEEELTLPGYKVEIEATVGQVEIIDLTAQECLEYFSRSPKEGEPCPRDRVLLRINKITPIENSNGEKYLGEGEEIPVYFALSARPAKALYDAKKVNVIYTEKNGSSYETEEYQIEPVELKEGYIVYHFAPGSNYRASSMFQYEERNITLLGLQDGDKIKFISWVLPRDNGLVQISGSQLFDVYIYDKI